MYTKLTTLQGQQQHITAHSAAVLPTTSASRELLDEDEDVDIDIDDDDDEMEEVEG